MACTLLVAYSIQLGRVLALWTLLTGAPAKSPEIAPAQVRVSIITETRGGNDVVELNGKIIANYNPTIIQEYSSTGIVFDPNGHIMTFLGYRWVDIYNQNPRIEITTIDGRKRKGKLIGIDQRNGVAVIKSLEGKLKETPICNQCEIKDGVQIKAPVIGNPGKSQYSEAEVLSVGRGQGIQLPSGLVLTVNRPIQEIGQPILTEDHRVFGFVAGHDPIDRRMVVYYPIDQLLSSAKDVLKARGDIRVGWLGVFVPPDSPSETSDGVVIQNVTPGSPAQKAGLAAMDALLKYNGREIRDSRQFIQLVQDTPIGSKANIEILRNGKPMTLNATIEARMPQPNPVRLSFNIPGIFDIPPAGMLPGAAEPQRTLGITAYGLTPFLADSLGMSGQKGLFVANVDKQKPADVAGLRVGDVIVEMDGQPIGDALNFTSFLLTHRWGDQLELRVLRKGIQQTIVIPFPQQ